MKIFFTSFLIVILFAGAGCSLNTNKNEDIGIRSVENGAKEETTVTESRDRDPDGGRETEESANREREELTVKEESAAEHEKTQERATTSVSSAGRYEAYASEKLALAANNKVVLFFHASWCPTCKLTNENLNKSAIPNGLIILKTDYDSSTELKKKYGVTYQHTFVQVDKDGNMLAKWSGSMTAEDIQVHVK